MNCPGTQCTIPQMQFWHKTVFRLTSAPTLSCWWTRLEYIVALLLSLIRSECEMFPSRWPPTSSVTSVTPPSVLPFFSPPGRHAGRLSWCQRKKGEQLSQTQPRAPSSGRSSTPKLSSWTLGGMEAAHTGRRLCSCRLMRWLIDLQPLYSFTARVWNTTLYLRGHVCSIPLSLYQSFSRSSSLGLVLPPLQTTFFVCVCFCTS